MNENTTPHSRVSQNLQWVKEYLQGIIQADNWAHTAFTKIIAVENELSRLIGKKSVSQLPNGAHWDGNVVVLRNGDLVSYVTWGWVRVQRQHENGPSYHITTIDEAQAAVAVLSRFQDQEL